MSQTNSTPSHNNLLQFPHHHHSSWSTKQKINFLKSISTISLLSLSQNRILLHSVHINHLGRYHQWSCTNNIKMSLVYFLISIRFASSSPHDHLGILEITTKILYKQPTKWVKQLPPLLIIICFNPHTIITHPDQQNRKINFLKTTSTISLSLNMSNLLYTQKPLLYAASSMLTHVICPPWLEVITIELIVL